VSQNVTIFSKKTLENKTLLGALVLGALLLLFAIYAPIMQIFIRTHPLEPIDWVMILITTIPILFYQEIYERITVSAESDRLNHNNGMDIESKNMPEISIKDV